MTVLDVTETGHWSATPAGTVDYPLIADFLATTHGLSGRKFAADSRDVAEQLASVFTATVLRDALGRVRGYAAVHRPHGGEPEVIGDFVIDPDVPSDIIDDVVRTAVGTFERAAVEEAEARQRDGLPLRAEINVVGYLARKPERNEGAQPP